MQTVLLVVHMMIAAALVGVVLLQRSEGGALGIGGGGGFMTGRGASNLLTRATGILAALFFLTSICLTLIALHGGRGVSPLDMGSPPAKEGPATPDTAPADGKATPGSVLDSLQKGRQPLEPQVPKSQ